MPPSPARLDWYLVAGILRPGGTPFSKTHFCRSRLNEIVRIDLLCRLGYRNQIRIRLTLI